MAVEGPTNTTADLLEFYPEADGDGLNITWAHAVNSKTELHMALKGKWRKGGKLELGRDIPILQLLKFY